MSIKVVTYNIRHCRGIDGHVDFDRVVRVLLELEADIICLQEVDRRLPRSGFKCQAEAAAEVLGFDYAYHANYGLLKSGMGNAILSRTPLYSTWNSTLPFLGEPRGLLHCATDIEGVPVQIFCTHWGLTPGQRRQQSRVTRDKVRAAGDHAILCGDLNAVRLAVEVDSLIEGANLADCGPADAHSFPSNFPVVKIDYVLATQRFNCIRSEILTCDASDHLPVVAELALVR